MRIEPHDNPFELFNRWLNDAKLTGLVKDPNAMTIVSVSKGGQPHARVVLCKDLNSRGFTFYTNYDSPKGRDFATNPRACALFFWDPLHRQIKIEGEVGRLSADESTAYWRSRARGSQLSQYVSKQSQPLGSRAELEAAHARADREFKDREVPRPENWGGFVLSPDRIEFWLGQPDRLHDRHEFIKSDGHWTHRLLYP